MRQMEATRLTKEDKQGPGDLTKSEQGGSVSFSRSKIWPKFTFFGVKKYNYIWGRALLKFFCWGGGGGGGGAELL